jgi:probable HAF family extracellular repeat protein
MLVRACVVLAAVPALALAQGTIMGIGVLSGGRSTATAVGDNGVLAGYSLVFVEYIPPAQPVYTNHAVLWTLSGGLRDLGPSNPSSEGRAINGNGMYAAGIMAVSGYRAMRWTEATGMVDLGLLPGSNASFAQGISGDGQLVVGYCSNSQPYMQRAFRWDAGASMLDLGTLPGDAHSSAEAVSRDGSTIVGRSYPSSGCCAKAFRWRQGSGMQDLGTLPNHIGYRARGVSEDGSVVVGSAVRLMPYPLTEASAFRWDSSGMTELPRLLVPDFWSADALGVTPDGQIAYGEARAMDSVPTGRAVIWTSANIILDLNTYLPSIGVDITGWELQRVTGMTNRGAFIVGLGRHDTRTGNRPEGFIVHLPQGLPCYANCDGSTGNPRLTANDFMCFINQFAGGAAYANCDGSMGTPQLTANDFACFINKYAGGCP